MQPVREIAAPPEPGWEDVDGQATPAILRALAADWPVVAAGRRSAAEALAIIAQYDSGTPAQVMIANPDQHGRFFYADDLRGFNFNREQAPLAQVIHHVLRFADHPEPPALYAGAAETARHLPGFDATHPLPLLAGETDAASRVWVGNRVQVATHFDLSDNIAVVAAGRRRFTLFPPAATKDLYIGPFDVTLAGQPISMVDPIAPDRERFERYAAAEAQALTADLGPGDAIYIPSPWWHHVAATDPVNVLVNYWYRNQARGGAFTAFLHALLAIRDLPVGQREAWRAWFDHFVFGADAGRSADHLPAHARGPNGPAGPARDEMIRRFVLAMMAKG